MSIPPRRIHLAHSDYFFHRAVASLLAPCTDMELEHNAAKGTQAVAAAQRLQPDVLLMGNTIENVSYLEVTRRIMASLPSTKIVLISTVHDTETMSLARAAGVFSYLTPDAMSTDFTAALRMISGGNMIFTQPSNQDSLPSRHLIDYDLLSRFMRHTTLRERRLLTAMTGGNTNAQIAALLNLSEGTVKAELAKIMSYFNVRTRVQLTVLLVQAGLFEVDQ